MIEKDEINLYLEYLAFCINNTLPIISNLLFVNNLFLMQENFRFLTKFALLVNYLLDKSHIKNFENLDSNAIIKLININTSKLIFNNDININNDLLGSVNNNSNLTFVKINIYAYLYKAVDNLYKIKEISFKSITNELMNFLVSIIIKHEVIIIIINFYILFIFSKKYFTTFRT